MLHRLKTYLFPGPLRDVPSLQRFLSSQASYIAQRSTYEFSRNTLAWFGQAAFGDPKFNQAFALCRWEAFADVAADMAIMVRAELAAQNAGNRLDPALLRLYADTLGEYPNPEHRPDGWADRHQTLLARFSTIAPASAPNLQALGRATGAAIHVHAPAKSKNEEEEREVLGAAITFGLVSFHDRLHRRIAREDIARALLSAIP